MPRPRGQIPSSGRDTPRDGQGQRLVMATPGLCAGDARALALRRPSAVPAVGVAARVRPEPAPVGRWWHGPDDRGARTAIGRLCPRGLLILVGALGDPVDAVGNVEISRPAI